MPRLVPNPQLDKLIQSTTKINSPYEIIIVTTNKHSNNLIAQNIQKTIETNPYCTKTTIIQLSADPGLPQARNIDAATAEANTLIFSDDDIILTQDITPLIDKLENNNYHSSQPLILKYPQTNVLDSTGDQITRLNAIYHAKIRGAGKKFNQLNFKLIPEQMASLRGAFFTIKKETLQAIGGFDGSLGFNFDDVDLGWRLTLAGYRNIFYPTVKVFHSGGRTTNTISLDEKAQRFHLVNHHIIQLKVTSLTAWPFILNRFEIFTIKHAITKKSTKEIFKISTINPKTQQPKTTPENLKPTPLRQQKNLQSHG